MRERQHAADLPVALGQQIVSAVTECAAQHVLPFGEMKKRSVRMLPNETRPTARGRVLRKSAPKAPVRFAATIDELEFCAHACSLRRHGSKCEALHTAYLLEALAIEKPR